MAIWARALVLATAALAIANAVASGNLPFRSVSFDLRRGVVVRQNGAPPASHAVAPPHWSGLDGARGDSDAPVVVPQLRLGSFGSADGEVLLREQPLSESHQRCAIACEYGYESDVEGWPLCRCFDPCKRMMCLDGGRCVAEQRCAPSGACAYVGACVGADPCAAGKPSLNSYFCKNAGRMYYYDRVSRKCRSYWGCKGGGGGGFESRERCVLACRGLGAAKPPRRS